MLADPGLVEEHQKTRREDDVGIEIRLRQGRGDPDERIEFLHSPVRSITASPPHTRARIVFGCEEGGVVLWGESADSTQTMFARDLMSPVVGLNRGGYLVAATAERVQVYRATNSPLPYLGEAAGPGTEPIAILAHEHVDQFAILSADGRVSCYEVKVAK